jgi:probable HAF family extracellular repeat protein
MAGFGPPFRLYRRQEIILSGGNMKSMLIAGLSMFTSLAFAQSTGPTYSAVDLGPLGVSPGSPYFIANNGLIAGAAGTSDNQSHAAAWFVGLKADLATAGLGGVNSVAFSVNDKGQVVGGAQSTTANSEDFCGFNAYGAANSSTACLPFLFENGVMTALPTLGGPNGTVNWINNRGVAVGMAETTSRDPNSACGVQEFLPVMWGKTGATLLKTFPGDPDGIAASINDNGQVVGASGTCGPFSPDSRLFLVEKHAMLWEGGQAIDLGNLGGTGNFAGHHACAINNHGQVTGHSDLKGDMTFHTFLWTWETGMLDIGTLPGDFASTAISINDRGVIAGVSLDSNFNPRAFVWENGFMTDLNAMLTSNPQKLFLLQANSINARGEIVGLAATGDGTLHGFLLTPDAAADISPAVATAVSRPLLSDTTRKMIFRQVGIRGR